MATSPWVQTWSGRRFDLLAPKPGQVFLADLAHSLARIARFNGHSLHDIPWSVAEHSILVMHLMPPGSSPDLLLTALLHDAPEAYIGDIVSPLKIAILEVLKPTSWLQPLEKIEAPIAAAIRQAFALPAELSTAWTDAIHHADRQALALEAEQLMEPSPEPWEPLPSPPEHLTPAERTLTPRGPKAAGCAFAAHALRLIAARHGIAGDTFQVEQV